MPRWAPPELVTAARAGDAEAVELLVSAVWPRCFRLAATLIGERSLAEDAAQEACATVYRKVRSVRAPEAFDAWLYRIVMREAARVRRRHESALRTAYESLPVAADDTVAIDLWRALGRLSPELRDVTVLFYFDDLKSEDIAAALRVPHATVRTRLLRARERLRGILRDYDDEPAPHRPKVTQHAF